MANIKWTEKRIAKMEKEGRGQGVGSNYLPWLLVRDISSLGRSRRPWSNKTGRVHQLLSDIEYKLFICLEWANHIVDIREQYPLDRELTRAVADELGIRHPYYPGTHVPTVMTIDFLATYVHHGEEVHVAFNAKPADEAEDEKSLNKLEIQRYACELLQIEHHLIFDSSIPEVKAKNIDWVRDALLHEKKIEPYPGYFDEYCSRMESELEGGMPAVNLQTYCRQFDSRYGTSHGVGLRVARMLLKNRTLLIDMDTPDIPGTSMSEFILTGSKSQLRVVGAQ